MRYYDGYPKYVSVAEKRAKAEKKLKQLKKKNPDMEPVIIEGTAIAKTWWGKEWNKNLERYADYRNRIGRGRSYVRHRAVLDLKISPGKVEALVSGSKPYSVTIGIKKISNENWAGIKQACKGNMENVQQLLVGKFPKKLADLFTQKGKGLFPSPEEIDLSCSCPDSAYMCKHIAAVLYGIGARLDSDPSLFFSLRKANMDDLISEAIKESKREILSKSDQKSSRVIEDDASLSEMFGIDLDEVSDPTPPERSKKAVKKGGSASKKSDASKTDERRGKKSESRVPRNAGKRTPKTKKSPEKCVKKTASNAAALKSKTTSHKQLKPEKSSGNSDVDLILQVLEGRKRAISVSKIIEQVNLPDQKVRNILYRLKVEGKLENPSRGMYRPPRK